jgi:hypothetical protein
MMPYEKSDAWKRCHMLALATHQATDQRMDRDPELLGRLRFTSIRAAARLAFASAVREKLRRQVAAHAGGYLSEYEYHLSLARVMGVLADDVCGRLHFLRERAAETTEQMMLGPPPSPPAAS